MLAEANGTPTTRAEKEQGRVTVTTHGGASPGKRILEAQVALSRVLPRIHSRMLVLRLHGHNTVTSFTLIVTRLATKLQESEEQPAARVTRAKASTSQGSARSEPEVWIAGVMTLAAKSPPGG
jgi:hypothetical protein